METQAIAEVKTTVLDHHGLIAAKCKDFQLAKRIDSILQPDAQRIVSPGVACVAMVINGLGFTNRRLYLTSQFFEGKPLQELLGVALEARHLNDDALGDALDAIANYGPSKLFGEVAIPIALEHKLLDGLIHTDTTSFCVEGEYKNSTPAQTATPTTAATAATAGAVATQSNPDEAHTIHITHGYSKDHRPDLKQAVLSLAVAGRSGAPLWMQPCDGNASDSKVLPSTVARVEAFCADLDREALCPRRFVADAAVYSEPNLEQMKDLLWVSRVPETVGQAKALVSRPSHEITWENHTDDQGQITGYQYAAFQSNYAGIEQRWLLIFSEQAYKREALTFEKALCKKEEALGKVLSKLQSETFACEQDARNALDKERAKHPLFHIQGDMITIQKYAQAGRPKAGQEKQTMGYQIQAKASRNQAAIDQTLASKGRFILATNDLDKEAYPDAQLLDDYKAQQTVERGFRFLKNPEFLAATFYLKSPKRIAALMMVMTLCLLVYNVAQFELREKLEAQKATLPNQVGKPTQRPTLRWVFQLMEGVSVVSIFNPGGALIHRSVANLNEVRIKIIRLFGPSACKIYGVAE